MATPRLRRFQRTLLLVVRLAVPHPYFHMSPKPLCNAALKEQNTNALYQEASSWLASIIEYTWMFGITVASTMRSCEHCLLSGHWEAEIQIERFRCFFSDSGNLSPSPQCRHLDCSGWGIQTGMFQKWMWWRKWICGVCSEGR